MALKVGIFLVECAMIGLIFGVAVDEKPTETNEETETGTDHQKGDCFCGVFRDTDDPAIATPIIEKKTPEIKFSHDDNGQKACERMCISMAESAKSKAPMVLCNAINEKQVENLKVKVYSRLCGDDWTFTGKISKSPVCCLKGQPVKCDIVKKGNEELIN